MEFYKILKTLQICLNLTILSLLFNWHLTSDKNLLQISKTILSKNELMAENVIEASHNPFLDFQEVTVIVKGLTLDTKENF